MPARSRGGLAAVAAAATVGLVAAFRRRRRARPPAVVAASREVQLEPNAGGGGVAVVANLAGGSADDALAAVEAGLADAEVVVMGADHDLPALMHAAAGQAGTRALGVVGGDGSVNAAAGVAADHGLPLLVVPGGTLNHLARDLGVRTPQDAVRAVVAGTAVEMDVAVIGDRPFLNTASFGSYAELVDARAALEDRIGKWPAVLVAGWRVLRRGTPVEVELDGSPHRLWMVFIGNCRYEPRGFAPSHRTRLDDGVLDIRWIDADRPFARVRLVAGLALGRIGRSPVYHEHVASSLRVRSPAGPLRLACDGETFDGGADVLVAKRERVVVYRPAPGHPVAGPPWGPTSSGPGRDPPAVAVPGQNSS